MEWEIEEERVQVEEKNPLLLDRNDFHLMDEII
jgi:hypothetical protein